MRKLARMRWLGAAVLLLAGCRSNETNLKPAKTPEEFTVPTDARFSNNVEYPKDTLFTDVIKKDSLQATSPASNPNRTPAGGGMGGRSGF
jgi:hypothetical protein